jgi:hypothetical protein
MLQSGRTDSHSDRTASRGTRSRASDRPHTKHRSRSCRERLDERRRWSSVLSYGSPRRDNFLCRDAHPLRPRRPPCRIDARRQRKSGPISRVSTARLPRAVAAHATTQSVDYRIDYCDKRARIHEHFEFFALDQPSGCVPAATSTSQGQTFHSRPHLRRVSRVGRLPMLIPPKGAETVELGQAHPGALPGS